MRCTSTNRKQNLANLATRCVHIDCMHGQNDAVPTEKKPATNSRKPPPPRRKRVGEGEDDQVTRRRPPVAGVDDLLTAEVLKQAQLRHGWNRSELSRRAEWNINNSGRLLNSKGPTQSWTAKELRDVARAMGCTIGSLFAGAGIDPAQVDEVDAIYSSRRLSGELKQAIVYLIRRELED